MISFEEMTKKQRRAFNKMCSIHGRSYVRETINNGTEAQRDFVFKVAYLKGAWWTPNNLKTTEAVDELNTEHPSTIISKMFEIPDSWYDRTQGQMQKGSYRMNRLNDTFDDWQIKSLLASNRVGKPLLFSMDISNLNDLIEYNSRWYMPAASADEAKAVFETMVLMPLGHMDDHHRVVDVKCHGLAEWFNYNRTNAWPGNGAEANYKKRVEQVAEAKKKLENAKNSLDMTIAILNQLRTFTDVSTEEI